MMMKSIAAAVTTITVGALLLLSGCDSVDGAAGGAEDTDRSKRVTATPDAARVALALALAQTTCPVMGGEINKAVYSDHDGKRVYFCCPGCDGTFKSNPQKYISKLEESGVRLEKAAASTSTPRESQGSCCP